MLDGSIIRADTAPPSGPMLLQPNGRVEVRGVIGACVSDDIAVEAGETLGEDGLNEGDGRGPQAPNTRDRRIATDWTGLDR